MVGSEGEKQPEAGGARAEQVTDNSQRAAMEGAQKPDSESESDGQNKNQPMTARTGQAGARRAKDKDAFVDRSVQKRLGSILRDSFADIENEALPDRLQDLIKALQAKEQSRR